MEDFKWANGDGANLKEPIENLKLNGWQYADVPVASNFNWLFNQIQKQLEIFTKHVTDLKSDIDKLNTTASKLISQTNSIENNIKDLPQLRNRTLRNTERINIHKRNIEFNEGISRQICMQLRILETYIRAYHPNLPELSWPLNDLVQPRINSDDIENND